ncbi:MAG: hypothetical protein MJ248_05010 [Bacilli bacterium]|nr:hypothetical protein [Bacilli bacterium]
MKEIDVRKETNKKYRKHASYNFSYGAFYAFFVIICFALAFFLPETLILTIPLIIIPFTFAYQFNTSIDNTAPQDRGFSLGKFFSLFKVYFQRPFFGAYRLFEGFFKSLGIFVGFYVVTLLIFLQSLLAKDPGLISMVSSLEYINDFTEMENLITETLLENEAFLNAVYLSINIALFPALYMFVHHIGTNSVKIHLSVASGQKLMMREVHAIHRIGFSTFRRQFYKDYYKTIWWIIPSLVVLYYGTLTLLNVLVPDLTLEPGIVGVAVVILFISFIGSYYFSCIETLFLKYQDKYIEASIAQSIKALNELKARNQMSEQEEKEIEEYINQTKEFLSKAQQEESEEDNEEQKNSDNSES